MSQTDTLPITPSSHQQGGTDHHHHHHFGAILTEHGVTYRGWFPNDDSIEVLVWDPAGEFRILRSKQIADGYHEAVDEQGRAGDQYLFRRGGGLAFPDPASYAITQIHGRSVVADQRAYHWKDDGWQRPPFRDLVIYEIHVGTFTEEGTFRAVIDRLPYMRELGVNAIQLMPIADFPGHRNWGYDGVLLYSPARAYGSIDDLKALVDAAHGARITVILDVVYNHLGPDGNYLPACSDEFFSKTHETPWGKGFNFDGAHSGPVREFFKANLIYWMEEFHIDGFRLDATHAIEDNSEYHVLAEMSAEVKKRGGYMVAEDERNEVLMLMGPEHGGCGFDAVWADDFHHNVRVSQTGDRNAYFEDFSGSADEFVDIMLHGWLYRGQQSVHTSKNRGTECVFLEPSKFLHCISNHDQVGNRAFGERLSAYVSDDSYRALSVLICLTPYTPMLFMGQEWAASTPFQFFTDHNDELGPLVTEGRRKEFASFPEFSDQEALKRVPDPQDPGTFENSKLKWSEFKEGPHGQVLSLYQECLKLRNQHGLFRPGSRDGWMVSRIGNAVVIRFQNVDESFLLLISLWEPCSGHLSEENSAIVPTVHPWRMVLSSNESRFGGDGAGFDEAQQSFDFKTPEVVVLRMVAQTQV